MSPITSAGIARAGRQTPRRHPFRFKARGASLGLTTAKTHQLVSQIEAGLPFKTLKSLAAWSGLPITLIASTVGIPERTLARRKSGGRFAPDESERLLRISTVFEQAVELFDGDLAGAVAWLTNPKKVLGDRTPLAYSRTEVGAREVENLIGRLEHGVFS